MTPDYFSVRPLRSSLLTIESRSLMGRDKQKVLLSDLFHKLYTPFGIRTAGSFGQVHTIQAEERVTSVPTNIPLYNSAFIGDRAC